MAAHALFSHAGTLATGEPRSFVFVPHGYYVDKPVTVHYYKPKNASAGSRLLFVIHGGDRGAGRELNHWIAAAERHGAIVAAPQFDSAVYPARLFQLGGIEETDRAAWSFTVIEQLFDKIRSEEELTTPSYLLFGHSAGAQFVHRLVLMMDRPRMSAAVAANAGTYTFPAYPASFFDFRFPWRLDERVTGHARLSDAFGRKLFILLGEEDVRTDGEFPGSREAMAQGPNRLERGRNFCAAARNQAAQLGVALRWQCMTVPRTGHSSSRMGRVAEKLLFEASD